MPENSSPSEQGMHALDLSGVERILCVVAHPDDLEYGISAAVAAWTAAGIEVNYLLMTAGEAGIRSRDPEEVSLLRVHEQRAACDVVGVNDLTVLDFEDGLMEYGIEVRRAIARHIRATRPNMVVTSNFDTEVPWGLNHVDHRATGLAAGDAIRDADNPWVFTELAEAGLEPWKADRFLVGGRGDANVYVDVAGDPLEKGIASLDAHVEYLAELGDHPAPREMLTQMSEAEAEKVAEDSVTHAIGFKAWDM